MIKPIAFVAIFLFAGEPLVDVAFRENCYHLIINKYLGCVASNIPLVHLRVKCVASHSISHKSVSGNIYEQKYIRA